MVEIIVTLTIIGLIFMIGTPKMKSRNVEFNSLIYEFKSDLRIVGTRSMNRIDSYTILLNKNNYSIYENNKKIKNKKFKSGYFILSAKKRIEYTNTSRLGAPDRGMTIYIFDSKEKELERITIMIGSGRIMSYREDYLDDNNKKLIDHLIEVS
ncbi:MAG: hypothetical protein RR561_03160 [Peptostreptococcus sp.]|uniref:pilus assembly FimT family protein n=1 Tax=Peptostreptococcus sp. TaxID=1262 RepID=UPI002FCACF62